MQEHPESSAAVAEEEDPSEDPASQGDTEGDGWGLFAGYSFCTTPSHQEETIEKEKHSPELIDIAVSNELFGTEPQSPGVAPKKKNLGKAKQTKLAKKEGKLSFSIPTTAPDTDIDKDLTARTESKDSKSKSKKSRSKTKPADPPSQPQEVPPTPGTEKEDSLAAFTSVLAQIQARLTSLEGQMPFAGFPPSSPAPVKSPRRETPQKTAAASSLGGSLQKSSAAAALSIEWEEDLVLTDLWDLFSQEPVSPRPKKGILSRSKSSVSFSEPEVQRLPVSQLSEGWLVFSDGMALGVEPGTLVFPD